ncbi:MAG: hypothetical protein ABSH17_12230 [Syntrophobacteraceae bacterium]
MACKIVGKIEKDYLKHLYTYTPQNYISSDGLLSHAWDCTGSA